MPERQSDRWVTPDTIKTGIRWLCFLLLVLIAAVTGLVYLGIDPAPLLTAIGAATTGLASVVGVALQLANRASLTRTERNTAPLAPGGIPLRPEELAPPGDFDPGPNVPQADELWDDQEEPRAEYYTRLARHSARPDLPPVPPSMRP